MKLIRVIKETWTLFLKPIKNSVVSAAHRFVNVFCALIGLVF